MEKQIIIPEGVNAANMAFSPAVAVGDILYLSGTAGCDSSGELVGSDITSQAQQALINLGEVLKAAGSSWDKVVKVNCFLSHVKRDFDGWNHVFKERFPNNPPARTTVQGDIALEGALIEIDCIAIR